MEYPRRLKGPLLKSTKQTTSTYSKKVQQSGDLSLQATQKPRKKLEKATEFDSSKVESPLLDPSIIERRVKEAKRASS